MPTYRQSSQNAGQVAKPRSLYDSVEQRRSPPCFVEKSERTFAEHALNAVFLGLPVNEPDLISRSSHLAEYTIVTIDCSSPEFRHFAEFPHVQSLNPLAPSAADVFLQLGACFCNSERIAYSTDMGKRGFSAVTEMANWSDERWLRSMIDFLIRTWVISVTSKLVPNGRAQRNSCKPVKSG